MTPSAPVLLQPAASGTPVPPVPWLMPPPRPLAEEPWGRSAGARPRLALAAPPAPRVRVHLMGALRIERDGQLLQHSGKSPRKPLELLALLAAHGRRPLACEQVVDELWPSLEAEAPRASLDMAVSRLRRLLGHTAAVRVAEGRLSLNAELVWTDVAAFEDAVQEVVQGRSAAALQALALYGDALLAGQPLRGLLRLRREVLAQRLVWLALDTGAALQSQGDLDSACRLYQHALERDPLSEPLYRELIKARVAQGEWAEAQRCLQRCRELLQTLLGVAPSAATLGLLPVPVPACAAPARALHARAER